MSIQTSNGTAMPLTVWIEPWCDELILQPRSELSLDARHEGEHDSAPEIEVIEDRLVVWAKTPGTLIVAIDGEVQDTASRTVALPAEMFEMSVRNFVNTAFSGYPAARPAGAFPPARRSIGTRLIELMRSAKLFPPAWIGLDGRR